MTTTDQKICGYLLAIGGYCHELREGRWCIKHEQAVWSVCCGCAGDAVRECPSKHQGEPCGAALCENCQHQFDDSHSRREQPFASPPPPRREAPPELVSMREQAITIVEQAVVAAQAAGKITFTGVATAHDVATEILDKFSMHVTVQTLTAISAAVPVPQEQR